MTITAERHTATDTAEAHPVSYERISRFRVQQHGVDVEVSRGVSRQRTDNDRCSEVLFGGPVPEDRHFVDDGRSASQYATKERTRWLALLDYLRSGTATHVLFWLVDRALRTTRDMDALLDACREGGVLIVQSAGSYVVADPNNPEDVFRLKLAGLLAEFEVAKMSMRHKRAKQSAADAGVAHGGRRRFGYEPGMVAIRDDEAAVVRDVAARLLAGESLHSCAQSLNRDQVVSPSGQVGKWTGSNLRTMMLRPHLAALRVHQGKVIGPAAWDPIITEDTRDSLVHLLTDPKRRTSYSNARKYLLAGLAVCAECGEVVRGRPSTTKAKTRAYACITGRHVHRSVEDVDTFLGDTIVARLEETDASGALVDSSAADRVADLRRELEALQHRVTEAADAFAAGRLPLAAYTATQSALDQQQAHLAAALDDAREAARRPLQALDGMTGPGARQAWQNAPLGQRRAVIAALCERVELVGAGANRRRPLEADDVIVTWKEDL